MKSISPEKKNSRYESDEFTEEGIENEGTQKETQRSTHSIEDISEEDRELLYRFDLTDFLLSQNLPFSLAGKLCGLFRYLAKTYSHTELISFSFNEKLVGTIAPGCKSYCIKNDYLKLLNDSPFSISLKSEYMTINGRFLIKNFKTSL
jgi:hypothetical protein